MAVALAVRKAAVEGEEEGKAGSSSSQPLITGASLAPPRIKTSVRGLIKQQQANATERQATLKKSMKQDRMLLNVPMPIPDQPMFPACSISRSYTWAVLQLGSGLLPAATGAPCSKPCSCSIDYLAHKHKIAFLYKFKVLLVAQDHLPMPLLPIFLTTATTPALFPYIPGACH